MLLLCGCLVYGFWCGWFDVCWLFAVLMLFVVVVGVLDLWVCFDEVVCRLVTVCCFGCGVVVCFAHLAGYVLVFDYGFCGLILLIAAVLRVSVYCVFDSCFACCIVWRFAFWLVVEFVV